MFGNYDEMILFIVRPSAGSGYWDFVINGISFHNNAFFTIAQMTFQCQHISKKFLTNYHLCGNGIFTQNSSVFLRTTQFQKIIHPEKKEKPQTSISSAVLMSLQFIPSGIICNLMVSFRYANFSCAAAKTLSNPGFISGLLLRLRLPVLP